MGLLAARQGFEVVGMDLQPAFWPYLHPYFSFIQADILSVMFPPEYFSIIINCSTVEHVGLVGRCGVATPRPDGDLEAIAILKILTRQGGQMLLTIPVGQDLLFPRLHRVHGARRLPLLLDGWEILRDEYWVKDAQNRWIMASKDSALGVEPLPWYCGLGLFVLRRPLTPVVESC